MQHAAHIKSSIHEKLLMTLLRIAL